MSTKSLVWALPLGLSLAFAACSEEDPDTGTYNNPSTNPGGAGGTTGSVGPGGTLGGVSPGGTTGGVSPGGTTGGVSPGGTTGGVSPGGTTGAVSPGGTTGGVSPGGTTGGANPGGTTGGGTPGGAPGAGGVPLVKCDTTAPSGGMRNTKPCGSFVSSLGVEFQLGPYGGQMDPENVGKGFETAGEGGADLICGLFVASFGEDPEASERLLNVEGLDMTLHTVYRPANWPAGKVPIVTWGNGTCAQPEGYGGLLRYIASHGFFVVAPNNRFVGDGSMQRKAIDFAIAANADPQSPYYGKLDTDKVIAMGHSQGGLGTSSATRDDPRIKAALLFNGGTSATKPFMAMSGDGDLGGGTGPQAAMDYGSTVLGSNQSKVAWMWMHMVPGSGHVTLMTQPERIGPAAAAWAKYILLDDPESKAYFAGPNCKLCGMEANFRFGQKGIQ